MRIRNFLRSLQLLEEQQVGVIRRQHQQLRSPQHAACLYMYLFELSPSAISVSLQGYFAHGLLHDSSAPFTPIGGPYQKLHLILLSKRMSASSFHVIFRKNRQEYRQFEDSLLC